MRLASISTQLLCHDWMDGGIVAAYKPQYENQTINTISWARNTGWMVVVPKSGNAEIISLDKSGKVMMNIQEIQHPTCACFQNMTKRNLAIGTGGGHLMIFDVKAKHVKKKYSNTSSAFFKVEYCYKDSHIIAGCENGEIYVYSSISSALTGNFKIPNSKTLTNFQCHPYKSGIVGGCSDEGSVAVWDVNVLKSLLWINLHKTSITDVTFSPTQPNLLVSIGANKRLTMCDLNSNSIITEFNLGKTPTSIDIHPDGGSFAIGFQDGMIMGYDSRNLKEFMYQLSGHRSKVGQVIFEKQPQNRGVETLYLEEISPRAEIAYSTETSADVVLDIPEELDCSRNNLDLNSASAPLLKENSTVGVITDGVKKLMNSKPNLLSKSPRYKYKKNSISNLKNLQNQVEFFKNLSCAQSSEGKSVQLDDSAKKYIREVIHEEMTEFKKEISELRQEMKFYMFDVMGSTRRQFLDLQMSLVKEFIRVEEYFNQLRADLSEPSNDN